MDGENYRYNIYYSYYVDDTMTNKIGESRYLTEYELNDKIITNSIEFQQRARRLQKSRAKDNKKNKYWYQTDQQVIFKSTK